MKKKPLSEPGALRPIFSAVGPPTLDQLQARTRKIARLAGRPEPHVTQRDYEQAKLELTKDPRSANQVTASEAVPPGRATDTAVGTGATPTQTYVLEPESIREQAEIEQLLVKKETDPPKTDPGTTVSVHS